MPLHVDLLVVTGPELQVQLAVIVTVAGVNVIDSPEMAVNVTVCAPWEKGIKLIKSAG